MWQKICLSYTILTEKVSRLLCKQTCQLPLEVFKKYFVVLASGGRPALVTAGTWNAFSKYVHLLVKCRVVSLPFKNGISELGLSVTSSYPRAPPRACFDSLCWSRRDTARVSFVLLQVQGLWLGASTTHRRVATEGADRFTTVLVSPICVKQSSILCTLNTDSQKLQAFCKRLVSGWW
jgi:hypothetical protein